MQLAHLEKLARTRLDDVLVEEGALDRKQVEEAQAEQERTGKQLGEVLVAREFLSDWDLAKLVVTHYPLPFLDLAGFTTRREVMSLLPDDFCARNAVLPLDQFGDVLSLAVCEVPSMELLEDIATRTKLTPSLFIVVRRALLEALGEGVKNAKKSVVKRATTIGAVPAAATAPAETEEDAADEAEPSTEGDESDLPLPDLVLPRVSMALVGAVPGAAKAPPPAPARPGSRTSVAPRQASVIETPAAAAAGGLRWMDEAAAAPDKSTPPKPALSTFKFAGSAAAGQRSKTSAPTPTAAPGASAKNGAWESIFDSGEAVVKRETTAGAKPPAVVKPQAK